MQGIIIYIKYTADFLFRKGFFTTLGNIFLSSKVIFRGEMGEIQDIVEF